MKITITSRSGKSQKSLITLDVPSDAKVDQLKREIHKKLPKYYPERQRLTFDNKLLEDKTLAEYGIRDGDTVLFKDLGVQIGWRTVFLIEYIGPLILHPIFYYFSTGIYGKSFEHSEMQTGLNLAYWVYGPWNARGTVGAEREKWYIWTCVGVWTWAQLSNLSAHITLRNLRPPGTRVRKIPYGYGFELVSCPNYFFELVAWAAIVALTKSGAALSFLVIAGGIMYLWAPNTNNNQTKDIDCRNMSHNDLRNEVEIFQKTRIIKLFIVCKEMNPASPFSRTTTALLYWKRLSKPIYFRKPFNRIDYHRYGYGLYNFKHFRVAYTTDASSLDMSESSTMPPEILENTPPTPNAIEAPEILANTSPAPKSTPPIKTKAKKKGGKAKDAIIESTETSAVATESFTPTETTKTSKVATEITEATTTKKRTKKMSEDISDTTKRILKLRLRKPELLPIEKVPELSKGLLSDLWVERYKLATKLRVSPPPELPKIESTDSAIEGFKPIGDELRSVQIGLAAYKRLITDVYMGFTVHQLQLYLKKHKHSSTGKKAKLVESIISDVWKVEDPYQKIIGQESVRCDAKDLYFLIGPEAETLQEIEQKTPVKIRINVSTFSYTITGPRSELPKAKKIIAESTQYTSRTVEVPPDIKVDNRAMSEILPYIQDICKNSGAYVEIDDENKLIISGRTSTSIEETVRLLNIAWAKPDHNENRITMCSSISQGALNYSLFPVHDWQSMSLFIRHLNWWRVGRVFDQITDISLIEKPTISDKLSSINKSPNMKHIKVDLDDIEFSKFGEFLWTYLAANDNDQITSISDVEVYSVFGHILFHDNSTNNQNLFIPPLIPPFQTLFSREGYTDWMKVAEPTQYFLANYPYLGLVRELKPNSTTKFVELEYQISNQEEEERNSEIIPTNPKIERVKLKFELEKEQMVLKSIEGSRQNLLVDMLMMDRPSDFRMVASRKIKLSASDVLPDGFLEECSYNSSHLKNIQCPPTLTFKLSEDDIKSQKRSPSYKLNRVLVHNNRNFEYKGSLLVAGNTREQETGVIRNELRLYQIPTSTNTTASKTTATGRNNIISSPASNHLHQRKNNQDKDLDSSSIADFSSLFDDDSHTTSESPDGIRGIDDSDSLDAWSPFNDDEDDADVDDDNVNVDNLIFLKSEPPPTKEAFNDEWQTFISNCIEISNKEQYSFINKKKLH
ncbi:12498_t:CDS:10 [Ambispora gerdemannii]|uniref:12498_t:CDS:1 n=1 Tax=Ambispora gerdemannii TaxID=144530 RepID=A0A9N8UZ81_9GLOM|nr:12498_t:CDS:10 [Ambispora gerdemannii]